MTPAEQEIQAAQARAKKALVRPLGIDPDAKNPRLLDIKPDPDKVLAEIHTDLWSSLWSACGRNPDLVKQVMAALADPDVVHITVTAERADIMIEQDVDHV